MNSVAVSGRLVEFGLSERDGVAEICFTVDVSRAGQGHPCLVRCVAYPRRGADQYRKGMPVGGVCEVSGRLRERRWMVGGKELSDLEVVAERIEVTAPGSTTFERSFSPSSEPLAKWRRSMIRPVEPDTPAGQGNADEDVDGYLFIEEPKRPEYHIRPRRHRSIDDAR